MYGLSFQVSQAIHPKLSTDTAFTYFNVLYLSPSFSMTMGLIWTLPIRLRMLTETRLMQANAARVGLENPSRFYF